jgi:hypothetical protein
MPACPTHELLAMDLGIMLFIITTLFLRCKQDVIVYFFLTVYSTAV